MAKRILVIDDDPVITRLVKIRLETVGYEVTTAHNGKEGFNAMMGTEPPDLIVLDIMMPEMDGYTFVRELRKNPTLKNIHVIMLTAKGQPLERKKGLEVGADSYVTKPFHAGELVAEIHSLLEQ